MQNKQKQGLFGNWFRIGETLTLVFSKVAGSAVGGETAHGAGRLLLRR